MMELQTEKCEAFFAQYIQADCACLLACLTGKQADRKAISFGNFGNDIPNFHVISHFYL